jgi:hypothetical protein
VSLDRLKKLAQERRYTEKMMKICLDRLVAQFLPAWHRPQLQDKSANEIAKYLLKIKDGIETQYLYRERLSTFQRMPTEGLQSTLARFTQVLTPELQSPIHSFGRYIWSKSLVLLRLSCTCVGEGE